MRVDCRIGKTVETNPKSEDATIVLKSWIVDFFTREKTPQNNFSSQNFSVENNYSLHIEGKYKSMALEQWEEKNRNRQL